jgi:predicted DNA-binding transcriptional regulator YafY
MSKASRLFDLMQLLRRHRHPVAGRALAREAGVSLRTIYRDIATLQAMGAAIDGEAGVGYVLRPGLLLPPLMFSEEELQALALGAQWVRRQADEGLALAAHDALSKIGAVLPSELGYVLHDNEFYVGRGAAAHAQSVDLKMLRQAMREQRKLRIAYRDPKGVETERIIWPIGLAFFESRRIIAGWCELRQDFRMFRTDRIERAELQTYRYPGRRRDLFKQWRALVADVTRRSP